MSIEQTGPLFSPRYWREAAKQFANVRMLALAAMIVALRVAVKLLRIPVGESLNLSLDFLVNSLGSLLYGPVMALAVGAVSDTLGALLFPSGAYFFPFIFVEMSSSFIFALFLWRRPVTVNRLILSRFAVTLVSNIILTPAVMIWYYDWLANGKTYRFITLPRVVKNVVMFPLECFLLVLLMGALLPALARAGLYRPAEHSAVRMTKRHWILIGALLMLSAAVLAVYYLYLLPLLG